MHEAQTDVLIRGMGPVGATLALALRGCALRVAVVDRPSPAQARARAFRPLALSYASRLILERIGVWHRLAPTPIERVHVSQQGGFGRTLLEAADAGVPALGYVVEYAALDAALRAELARAAIAPAADDAAARCEVHAEGWSDAAETRYAQDALVARVGFARPAIPTAYERFTSEGPLALLPLAERCALIWSMRPERARNLLEADEPRFLEELSAALGPRPGEPVAVDARSVQPLALRVRSARVHGRAVYIGNAAQTLHPVAGQGLNLGLRDAWELARILRGAGDPGDPALLARYASRRRLDTQAAIRVTDALARAFLGSSPLASLARGAALAALDVLPAPRRFFARRMIYGPSALP
jgi:2-octaprenyl-6-methoxyphenol hydroxylase